MVMVVQTLFKLPLLSLPILQELLLRKLMWIVMVILRAKLLLKPMQAQEHLPIYILLMEEEPRKHPEHFLVLQKGLIQLQLLMIMAVLRMFRLPLQSLPNLRELLLRKPMWIVMEILLAKLLSKPMQAQEHLPIYILLMEEEPRKHPEHSLVFL